jgi:hypothetical protein
MAMKAFSIHPSNQGVCGRHGVEEHVVTPGDLIGCSACKERGAKAHHKSKKAKGWPVFGEKSEDGEVPEARARQPARPGDGRRSAPGKAVREGDRREMGGQ